MFSHFWQNLKIQNGRHVWGGENFSTKFPQELRKQYIKLQFLTIDLLTIQNITIALRVDWSDDTLWVENFDEVALSRTVKEIEANLCFPFLAK